MKQIRLCASLASLLVAMASVLSAQSTPPRTEGLATTNDSLETPAAQTPSPPPRHFSFENRFTNVYDSNIEHDSTNIGSYGVVVGANARYRKSLANVDLLLDYGVAVHQYTATDKWDRVSQIGRAGVDVPLGDVFVAGVTAEAFLKGSSEDREIGDQYAIIPRLEIKPVHNLRIRVIGAYRRRFFELETSNAINRYVTVDSRIRVRGGMLEGSARIEENRPRLSRLRFQRQTYSAAYTWLLGRNDDLLLGLEYRPVKYPGRMVDIELDDGDQREEPRRDERWKPQVRWVHDWTRKLRTELEYEYEMRLSNDPDKKYRGNVLTFLTVIPW